MKNSKILLCDDMVMIRSLVKKSLIELGYKNLFEAADGKEALNLIKAEQSKNEPFDLVFMDWNMPNMSGIEVVQICKKDPHLSNIPFIMISAERDHKNIVQALNSGVVDYIMKPFSPAVLSNKITKIVGLKQKAG
ncbi:MAG: response regulator [Pseudobdellovibrionaceae bacterium]